jgi:hypothetical protein
MADKLICERSMSLIGRDGQKSSVRVAILLPHAPTRLESKLGQVACIVETDVGLGAARREVLGHDLMNAMAQAFISVEVFIMSLSASAELELEDGTRFDREEHSVFFGDVYEEYRGALEERARDGNRPGSGA